MSDHNLSELLERTGDALPVSRPPIAEMLKATHGRRRRLTWGLVVVSSAAAASVVVAVSLLQSPTPNHLVEPQPAASSQPIPPPGTRLVGIGHVAVSVPKRWGTNEVRCGTPQKDTVIIDQAVVEACATSWPPGVDSVTLSRGKPRSDLAGDRVTIGGVEAEQSISCEEKSRLFSPVCVGSVSLRSEGVWISVGSDREAVVDRILGQVYVLPDSVGVPGFLAVNSAAQQRAEGRYLELLDEAGLEADVRYVSDSNWPAGFVVGVSPDVGTMIGAGDTVTVTIASQ